MNIPFVKMHGIGNDYLLIDELKQCYRIGERTSDETAGQSEPDRGQFVRRICDRHFGVGADGVIFMTISEKADFRMSMYNADGSRGEMCGNGIRCVAKYLTEYGYTEKRVLSIESAGRIYQTETILDEQGTVKEAVVSMGVPKWYTGERGIVLEIQGQKVQMQCLSIGNPHAVLILPTMDDDTVRRLGPLIEHHPFFRNRTNVEFVQIIHRNEIRVRVWERGSGETLACGTGSCAAVAVCIAKKLTSASVNVTLLGGKLQVWQNLRTRSMYLQGPAEYVCAGEYMHAGDVRET